jgi:hydroxyethylthiazole kinase-like uncharacterized protein yjeF
MTELLTAAQMRAIEQAAIESGEVTGLELMERAGEGVVDAIFAEWPELRHKNQCAVILCGPGNNGGDGFVIARLLQNWGWDVDVLLYGDQKKLPPDAKANFARWCQQGAVAPLVPGAIRSAISKAEERADYLYDEDLEQEINLGPTTIYIDALFGTGLVRKFDDTLLEMSGEWTDTCYHHGVAVDIPSGLCSDSGKVVGGNWLFSKLVVTFEAAKIGLFLPDTCYDIRRLRVVPLGISGGSPPDDERVTRLEKHDLELDATGFFEDGLNKSVKTHKYSHGHGLILSGGVGKGGAARLAVIAGAPGVVAMCPRALSSKMPHNSMRSCWAASRTLPNLPTRCKTPASTRFVSVPGLVWVSGKKRWSPPR